MNKKHDHGHSHPTHSGKKSGIHRDWRLWVVVVLMLAAMAWYVISDDESIMPTGVQTQQPMPAAP